MKQIEKVVKTKEVFNGHLLNLRVDDVELPNGEFSKREIVSHQGAVALLVMKDRQFYFVQQYRIAVQRILTEIPAGLIEIGENPKDAAIRECQEEIGYRPLNLTKIGKFIPTPGYCSEYITLYCATEFVYEPKKEDPDEFIKVIKMPVRTVKALFQKGFFKDGKTVAALGYYFSGALKSKIQE
jgi:ADP-ribose pyrophosphatase